jgi:hypothetical protein
MTAIWVRFDPFCEMIHDRSQFKAQKGLLPDRNFWNWYENPDIITLKRPCSDDLDNFSWLRKKILREFRFRDTVISQNDASGFPTCQRNSKRKRHFMMSKATKAPICKILFSWADIQVRFLLQQRNRRKWDWHRNKSCKLECTARTKMPENLLERFKFESSERATISLESRSFACSKHDDCLTVRSC